MRMVLPFFPSFFSRISHFFHYTEFLFILQERETDFFRLIFDNRRDAPIFAVSLN